MVLQQRRYLEGTLEKVSVWRARPPGRIKILSLLMAGEKLFGEQASAATGLMLTSVPHPPFIGRLQPETNWPGTLRNIAFHTLNYRKESQKCESQLRAILKEYFLKIYSEE